MSIVRGRPRASAAPRTMRNPNIPVGSSTRETQSAGRENGNNFFPRNNNPLDARFLRGGSAGNAGTTSEQHGNVLSMESAGQKDVNLAFAVQDASPAAVANSQWVTPPAPTPSTSSSAGDLSLTLSDDIVSVNGVDPDSASISSARSGYNSGSHANTANPAYRTLDTKDEIMQLQMALHRTNASGSGGGAKLVSGSQFRSPLDRRVCESCSGMHDKVKKGREALRTSKLQLGRAEEKIRELEKIKENADRLQSKLLMGGCAALQDNTAKLQQALDNQKTELLAMAKKYKAECDARSALTTSMNELTNELQSCRRSEEQSRAEATRLRDAVSAAEAALDARRKALEQQKMRYEALLRDAKADVDDARERDAREAALREELANAHIFARDLEERLAARERSHAKDAAKAQAALKEYQDRHTVMEQGLQSAHAECETQAAARNHAECHAQDLELELSKLKATMQENKDIAAAAWEAERGSLQAEVARLRAQNDDIMERLKRDSENTTKALEKAIGASVRLCVVAPTVNVVVQDKKIQIESSLEEEAMRREVQEKVLKPYSQIFKQDSDEAAPDGSDLGAWIQKMLHKMQSNIEQHIVSSLRNRPNK